MTNEMLQRVRPYKLNADELKRLQIEVWFGKVLLIRRLTNGESSMKIRERRYN